MTDQEHANEIATARDALWSAMQAASKDGLRVDVDMRETQQFYDRYPQIFVDVRAYRELKG